MNIRDQAPAWTIPELMKHWKMSRNTLGKLIASGSLKYMNLSWQQRRKKGEKPPRKYIRVRDSDRLHFENTRLR